MTRAEDEQSEAQIMKVIHKKVLSIKNEQIAKLPVGANILAADNQREQLCIWYLTDSTIVDTEQRSIIVVGTGHKVDTKPLVFIDTVLFQDGELVLHVFEELK